MLCSSSLVAAGEMENRRYFLYKCPKHAANLNNMRLNNKWCDVTITVDDQIFFAHKVVLAASLKYFENELSHHSDEDIIKMNCLQGSDLEEFLCYAYTGEILITDTNALGLLEVANYLKEDEIKKACIEFLENHLRVEDALRAYNVGSFIECQTLQNVARITILSNFEKCSQTLEYLDLDFECLKDLLAGVVSNYPESQRLFFEGIIKWIMHGVLSRKNRADDLLSLIDTTKFEDDYLKKYLGRIEQCNNNNYKMIKNIIVSRVPCSESHEATYKLDGSGQVLMILGDVSQEPHFQFYTFAEKKWSSLHQVPDAKRMYSNSAILNDKLYYINRNFGKNNLQMFNLKTKRSTRLYSSSSVYSWSSICACNNFIYLCGGKEFVVEYDQVLRYDPLRNSFEALCPMRRKRSHAVAVFYQGCLYVLGGRDGSHGVTAVERYDPNKKTWTTLASMSEGRYGHAVAILNEKLYVCGGSESNSVEVYDPAKNIWQMVAKMNKKRYNFFVITHAKTLMAIGGDKEPTVEVYEPGIDEWGIDHDLSSDLQILHPRGGLVKIYP